MKMKLLFLIIYHCMFYCDAGTAPNMFYYALFSAEINKQLLPSYKQAICLLFFYSLPGFMVLDVENVDTKMAGNFKAIVTQI